MNAIHPGEEPPRHFRTGPEAAPEDVAELCPRQPHFHGDFSLVIPAARMAAFILRRIGSGAYPPDRMSGESGDGARVSNRSRHSDDLLLPQAKGLITLS